MEIEARLFASILLAKTRKSFSDGSVQILDAYSVESATDLIESRDAAIRAEAAEDGAMGLHIFLQNSFDANVLQHITLEELKDTIRAVICHKEVEK